MNSAAQPNPASTSRSSRWRAWKIGLCLLAIFVGGATVGALTTLRVLQYGLSRRADPVRWTTLILDLVDDRAHLTAAQRHELEPVVRAGIDATFQVRDHAAADIGEIVQRTRTRAAPMLSLEQQRQVDSVISDRSKLMHRWLGSHLDTPPAGSPTPAN